MSIRVSALRPVVRPVVHGVLCGGGEAAASSTLLDGLVSWWSLDEASGSRVDSHGSNNLTDNNTVGSAAGKVSTAADFEKSNHEWLSGTVGIASAFSFAAWVRPESLTINYIFDGSGAFLCDLFIFAGNYQCRTASSTIINSGVAAQNGVWAFLAFGHSGTAGFISVNGGAKVTASTGTLAAQSGVSISKGLEPWDGLIDEAALWNRELTVDEITELYNGGSGIGYPG